MVFVEVVVEDLGLVVSDQLRGTVWVCISVSMKYTRRSRRGVEDNEDGDGLSVVLKTS